jgi:hypothetical protein
MGIFSIPKQYPYSTINDSVEKFRLILMDSLSNVMLDENNTNKKQSLQISIDSILLSSNSSGMISQINYSPFEENTNLFYLGLKNYKLRDEYTKFYMDKGTYNLAIVKWDTPDKWESSSYDKTGYYVSKKIGVRYSEHNKKVLIPISKRAYDNIKFSGKILTWLFVFFSLYIFIGLPFQILLNISKGRAFNIKNIKYLKTITITTCIISLLSLSQPYLTALIFKNKIPGEISQAGFMEITSDNFSMIVFSIALVFIAKAFMKGYRLQQEQDLTV